MFVLSRPFAGGVAISLLSLSVASLQARPFDGQAEALKASSNLQVITLAPSEKKDGESAPKAAAMSTPVAGETEFARRIRESRANYREFEKVRVQGSSSPERFVLQFHGATKVTGLSATGDFRVTGGSCAEGRNYVAGESCEVEVTFAPRGPGRRTGQLKVEHTASATPMSTPLGGTAYGPTISFTPSLISNLAGSYVGGTTGGLISGPGQLATDGGDSLYIADPGNHLIRKRDSSGVITTLIGGGTESLTTQVSGFGPAIQLSAPTGVAVDSENTCISATTLTN